MVQIETQEINRRRKIGISISKSMNLKYDVNSILKLSTRTSQKILKRMWVDGKLKCSNCGWNETTCDLHHIKGRKIKNADSHDNLTYLCPNCHRLAHRGILTNFIPISVQIGDEWMNYFYGFRTLKTKEQIKIEKEIRDKKRIEKLELNEKRKLIVLNSDIQFNKFGWGVKLSKNFNISPQKTKVWVKKHMSEFYELNCYKKYLRSSDGRVEDS